MSEIQKLPEEVINPAMSEAPLPADPIVIKINEIIDKLNEISSND